MGTRGLVFIRCCGRYYVYYNHLDSYPEGLGEAIVAEIPADPAKYREWLESMRQTYSRLSQQFEEHVLCVPPIFGHLGGISSPAERYARSYLAVDDRLEMPPTQTLLDDVDCWNIEWTYTIDLDRELLGVDKSVFFQLSKLPHNQNWTQYLSEDHRQRRILSKDTPHDLIGNPLNMVEVDGELRARYKFLNVLLTWYLLDAFYHEWTSASFPFKEIAFAILSVATGEITLEPTQGLNGSYTSEGFYLIPHHNYPDDQHTLLPIFLRECHIPGAQPGSAPNSATFWLGNVLVHLAPRIDLIEAEEAAIATVVNAGLSNGMKSFRALVFSILDFILIDVRKIEDDDVRVTRSPLINLVYFADDNSRFPTGPRTSVSGFLPYEHVTEYNEQGDDDEEEKDGGGNSNDDDEFPKRINLLEMVDRNIGLASCVLIHFFDAATDQCLANAKSSVIPNEILSTIMEFSDHRTYSSLAKVSACCRDLYYRKFRLNDDYAIVDQDYELGSSSFTVEDLHSGRKIRSVLGSSHVSQVKIKLSPIIGIAEPSRRSILNELSFTFSNISPKRPPYAGKKDMPIQEKHLSFSAFDGPKPERLFQLPDFRYLGSLEDAFGRYIIGLTQEQSTSSRLIRIDGASYRCLLPHGYSELTIDPLYSCCLRLFLRLGNCESAEEWENTIAYAVKRLHRKEREDHIRACVRGCPVVIGFTRRVKLFYYVHKCVEKPSDIVTSLPHCVEIAKRCTESDPYRRLVDLLPGHQPLDLDDKKHRDQFENWILEFCKPGEIMKEWDPFTTKHVSIDTNRDEDPAPEV